LTLALGATTTDYYYSVVGFNYVNTSAAIGAQNQASFDFMGHFNTDGLFMNLDILAPNLAKNTMVNGGYAQNITNGAGFAANGYLANTTAYTAFTVGTNTGTITGGTIRVYGYRN